MAFNLQSGNGPLAFKNMGSSPNKMGSKPSEPKSARKAGEKPVEEPTEEPAPTKMWGEVIKIATDVLKSDTKDHQVANNRNVSVMSQKR